MEPDPGQASKVQPNVRGNHQPPEARESAPTTREITQIRHQATYMDQMIPRHGRPKASIPAARALESSRDLSDNIYNDSVLLSR